jgi:hypothetical protein
VLGDIPNTGVCVINLPSPHEAGPYGYGSQPFKAALEIYASTDHLGPESRIAEFLALRSGTALPPGAEPSDWLRSRQTGAMREVRARL